MLQPLTCVSSQPLCLGVVGHDCDITHVVQPGDNCDVIAQEAKITREILLANNPNVNTDCTNIGVGEVSAQQVLYLVWYSQVCMALPGPLHGGRDHRELNGQRGLGLRTLYGHAISAICTFRGFYSGFCIVKEP